MKMRIWDDEIDLNPVEIRAAKKMILKFIKEIENKSFERKVPTFYLTSLIVMHVLSQELLEEIDKDTLKFLIENLKVQN